MHTYSAQRRLKVKPASSDLQTIFLQHADMERNERLKIARTRRFRTAKAAAGALNVPYGTYSGHEAGTRGFNEAEARHYASAFRVRLPWLLLEDGPMESGQGRTSGRRVPVMGCAAAGNDTVTFFGDGQGPIDEVDAPDWATKDTVAVQIRGTSIGRMFDGWIAFYDDRRDPPDESLHGRVCICGLADGRVVIKKLRAGSARGKYHLESESEPTMFDERVDWAAEVREMRSR